LEVEPPAGQHRAVPVDPLRRLLDAAVEGDDRAMGDLVRRTQVDVWKVCAALGSRGEEEDLVQETYLRAVRSAPSYRGDAPVRAWLLAIARHVCADHVRRRERQRRLVRRIVPEVTSIAPVGDPSAVDLVERIDPDRRDAFVLTQVAGLSYEEAAAALGCPIGTIRSRVARARADLLQAVRQSDAV
jgi:RNA polymerase sigma-70 factor (ECF subfamily)